MLLDEIIELASSDDKQSIGTLLRRCLILASELKNERLKVWANGELNGYPHSEEHLPPYRVLKAGAEGRYIGPGFTQTQRIIPSAMLEEKHRDWGETVYLSQSITTLEQSLKSESNSLVFPWNHNLVLFYQDRLLPGWTLATAGQEIPKSVIAGLVDSVRTRALNMALDLKTEFGDVPDLWKVSKGRELQIDNVVVSNITGDVYVTAGQSSMNVTAIQQQNIVAGDWKQLSKVLRDSGISEPELAELSTAIKEDGQTMGSKVTGWISKTAPKVLSGGVKVGTAIGQTLLIEFLKRHYGLS